MYVCVCTGEMPLTRVDRDEHMMGWFAGLSVKVAVCVCIAYGMVRGPVSESGGMCMCIAYGA